MARLTETSIAGVLLVEPEVRRDLRGLFVETYRREWFPDGREVVQANRAERVAGSVVGLHLHLRQTDLWAVSSGRMRAVLHDLRAGSPSEGVTLQVDLDAAAGDAHRRLRIPPGVAHGFGALTDVVVEYLVDRYYDPDDELGLAWDDPEVGADWGIARPVLSERDRSNPSRSALGRVVVEP